MKKFTITLIIMALAVVTFGQTVQNAKTAREAGVVTGGFNFPKATNMLNEGFESFVIPGTMNGWTLIQNNVNKTWDTTSNDPYAGTRNVHCEYDDALVQQDEWLVTPALNLSAASGVTVNFAWNGSKYWGAFPNDNYDLFLKYSIDGGTTWSGEVWSEMTDDTALWISWTWAEATVNVPVVAGNANVKFALQYWGLDGAEWNIDAFKVDTTCGGGAGVNEEYTNGIKLSQNQPNPATNATLIQYEIQNNASVSLEIYDITGRLVLSYDEGKQIAGKHNILVDSDKLMKGTYFYSLKADNYRLTKKMIITQ
ncbi:MAG: T9SS type A sorting domain-containing protein [Bacteroidales bacterium]